MSQGITSLLPAIFVSLGTGGVLAALINGWLGRRKDKAQVVDIGADAAQKQVNTSLSLVDVLDKQLHDTLTEVATLRAKITQMSGELDIALSRAQLYARVLRENEIPLPQETT